MRGAGNGIADIEERQGKEKGGKPGMHRGVGGGKGSMGSRKSSSKEGWEEVYMEETSTGTVVKAYSPSLAGQSKGGDRS